MDDNPDKLIITLDEHNNVNVVFEGSAPKCTLIARVLKEQVDDVVRMASENRIEYTRMMEQRILEELSHKDELDDRMAP